MDLPATIPIKRRGACLGKVRVCWGVGSVVAESADRASIGSVWDGFHESGLIAH